MVIGRNDIQGFTKRILGIKLKAFPMNSNENGNSGKRDTAACRKKSEDHHFRQRFCTAEMTCRRDKVTLWFCRKDGHWYIASKLPFGDCGGCHGSSSREAGWFRTEGIVERWRKFLSAGDTKWPFWKQRFVIQEKLWSERGSGDGRIWESQVDGGMLFLWMSTLKRTDWRLHVYN